MNKIIFKHGIFVTVVAFGFALAAPVVVTAQNARAQASQENAQTNQSTTAEERKALAQGKLEEAKLRVCQNREKAITNTMARIADRGQKQLDLFTKIAERTQEFYVEKGRTLSNYEALVAEVNAKKEAAQATVDTIKSSSTTFNCESDNPKGMADAFKESLKAEIAALKEYRTAVKNLIVGVKSVNGKTQSAENGGQE